MNIEALIEKPPVGYRLVKRYRGAFIECEFVPIGFSGVESWDVPKDDAEIEPSDEFSPDDFIVSEAHPDGAREDGNYSLALESKTHAASVAEVGIPHGNGEVGTQSSVGQDGDEPLKFDTILSKWEARSIGQGLSEGTKEQYRRYFSRFAAYVKLDTRERKWLSSKGKQAAIEWAMGLPEKSRRMGLAALESVWTFGMPEIPYPINKKRDFGRKVLPKAGQRDCPTDADVEPIFRAAEHEDDLYLKSFVLVELNTGMRPGNQLAQLQWADVREWHDVLAIVAESKPGREFKTKSPVITRLPPVASDSLKAWKAQTPNGAPGDYIWPRRQYGEMTALRGDYHTTEREYANFLGRHRIQTWVRVCHIRHWVEYRGEKDGIPSVHLAYMRGHSVKSATEGRLGYSGNRKLETILEDQEARWPEGPCGFFTVGQVRVVDELSPYMAVMAEYQKGNMTTDVMARRMESVRLKLLKQGQTLEP